MEEDLVIGKLINNNWTILSDPFKKESGKRVYYIKCRCLCGKEQDIPKYTLIKSPSKCCRDCFLNKKRLNVGIGHIHGKWTVIGTPSKATANKKSTVLCRCECGREKLVRKTRLLGNSDFKCKECSIQNSIRNVWDKIWHRLVYISNRRKKDISVTQEDIMNLFVTQKGKCALTGVELSVAESISLHDRGFTTASLDRKDSKKGYEIDNIQWVHKDINILKLDNSDEEFIRLCTLVAEHNKKIPILPEGTLTVF